MIDIEALRRELIGPRNVKYDGSGRAVSWTSTNKDSDKYNTAMQTIVIAELSNAVEELNQRLKMGPAPMCGKCGNPHWPNEGCAA